MNVRTEIAGGIGRITLDQPGIRNALSAGLMEGLSLAIDACRDDPRVRALLIAGEGKAFCAGADLRSMSRSNQSPAEANRADAYRMGELFHRIADCPKPVLARVHGPAIGGGVGLMAACDIVVAAAGTRFQFSEVRLGIVPAVISPFCIRRLGPGRARRLFLTGEPIDAAMALAWGLVDVVAEPEDLDAAVERVCADLAKAGPRALIEAKRLVSDVTSMPANEILAHTAELIARLRVSEEAVEGMMAFLEKRPPSWVEET